MQQKTAHQTRQLVKPKRSKPLVVAEKDVSPILM
jgi:hypothetical protein